ALLVAMDRWVRDGVAPPPSAHPRLVDKTLVPRDSIDFPAIPGVRLPLTIPAGYRADLERATHRAPAAGIGPAGRSRRQRAFGHSAPKRGSAARDLYRLEFPQPFDRSARRIAPAHRLLRPISRDKGGTRGSA